MRGTFAIDDAEWIDRAQRGLVLRVRRDVVVVTRHGKPVSGLLPLERGADLERLSLSMNPRFRAIPERSRSQVRAGKGVSSDEVRRLFGLKRKAG